MNGTIVEQTEKDINPWEAIKYIFSAEWNLQLINEEGVVSSKIFFSAREDSLTELVEKKVLEKTGNQDYYFKTPYFHGGLIVSYLDGDKFPLDSLDMNFEGLISYEPIRELFKEYGITNKVTARKEIVSLLDKNKIGIQILALYLTKSTSATSVSQFEEEKAVFLNNLSKIELSYLDEELGVPVNIALTSTYIQETNETAFHVQGEIKKVDPLKLQRLDYLFGHEGERHG